MVQSDQLSYQLKKISGLRGNLVRLSAQKNMQYICGITLLQI